MLPRHLLLEPLHVDQRQETVHYLREALLLPHHRRQVLVRLRGLIPHARVGVANDALHGPLELVLVDFGTRPGPGHAPPGPVGGRVPAPRVAPATGHVRPGAHAAGYDPHLTLRGGGGALAGDVQFSPVPAVLTLAVIVVDVHRAGAVWLLPRDV
eukprot:CAMPEP_0172569132 /NCGR_PEP_ID=MMETSP1067-20121228/122334_1 /TAXON_ID=265564 ORGANISM="Thalassiosira punctigera, Strain Tpunct2005C2" /NCGR_SAMPLE_ID=MMETSP1067 /ASSEMBLY_ACC=CAM_ASM_000444 /LENGTH=154 /DNA_ID=CAMNT_0013360895 /DNA_START=163 /DNA_END=627 /DNA_ORIENTATION=+